MFLRFSAAVRVFAIAAIIFTKTGANANFFYSPICYTDDEQCPVEHFNDYSNNIDDQLDDNSQVKQLIDATKVAACVVDGKHGVEDEHVWDFEFEGCSEHGGHSMKGRGRPIYCAYITQSDKFKPANQDEIDQ